MRQALEVSLPSPTKRIKINKIKKIKVKLSGSERCGRLRLAECLDNRYMKVASLSAQAAFVPRRCPWYPSLLTGWVDPGTTGRPEG